MRLSIERPGGSFNVQIFERSANREPAIAKSTAGRRKERTLGKRREAEEARRTKEEEDGEEDARTRESRAARRAAQVQLHRNNAASARITAKCQRCHGARNERTTRGGKRGVAEYDYVGTTRRETRGESAAGRR